MATERQINANRANALKSTGPVTPEGKRISSKNGALPSLVSGTVVLKRESIRRFNELAAALALQFKPRNSAEVFLIQTMTVARWRLLRMWGIQTAGFELEMARVRQKSGPSAESGAVLAAVTFRILADDSGALPSFPPIRLATETWGDTTEDGDSPSEANSEANSGDGSQPS